MRTGPQTTNGVTMSAAVVPLRPGTQDNVVFDTTTRFPYPDVAKFVAEAEKLQETHSLAVYCTMLAASYKAPLGEEYAKYFPDEHPWLIDAQQEMIAKRLVRFFYRPRFPQSSSSAKMLKIEGIVHSFRFDNQAHKLELMELFETNT